MKLKPITILESFDSQRKVDADKGIIEDVKFIGLESKKGYDYDPNGLKKAVKLYEGVKVYADHPDPKNPRRSMREVIAVAVNPRFVEGDGIRVDIKVFKESPGGRQLLEAAQDDDKSKVLGFSHNADPAYDKKGKAIIVRKNGRDTVMGISKVYSLDAVDTPATTNGIYESEDMKTTVRERLKKIYPAGKVICLLEDMEMPVDTSMPAGPESEGEQGHEAVVSDAFLAMVSAIWSDESLDMKAKLEKIKQAATAQEKMVGTSDEGEAAKAMTEEEKKPEEGKMEEEDDKEKKDDGEKKEEDETEKKKSGFTEGKPIKVGRLMELARKYKVDDQP